MSGCNSDAVVMNGPDKVGSFQKLINSSGSRYVYAFFHSPGCGHCHALMPYFTAYRNQCTSQASTAIIVFINRQTAPELFEKFNVTSFPHVMVFQNGSLVDEVIGNDPAAVARAFAKSGLRIK